MTSFDLPQEFEVVLTLENQWNSVHLLNIVMICREAEKVSDEIQHLIKTNTSK